MLEKFGHGGDLRTASELYGIKPQAFLDFSANLNPFGPPKIIGEILQNEWRSIAAYPDPASRELRAKLAEQYDVPQECIWIGNGAAELIELAVRLIQPNKTALARPSFSEYELAVTKINGEIIDIPLCQSNDFMLEKEPALKAFEQADAIFLGNPNNPTGKLLPGELLNELCSLTAPHKTVFLDEAFLDFLEDEHDRTMIRQAADTKGLFVIRSMTKFFAVPGLRLGFVVAHPEQIERLAKMQTPWSVNGLAQKIGAAVLNEAEYIQHTRNWLKTERPWFQEQLQEIGLKVFTGAVNFVLFQIPEQYGMTIQDLQRKLGERGILIRDASHFIGLDQTFGRLAVKTREQNVILLRELREMLR